jgi:hypothetical protein
MTESRTVCGGGPSTPSVRPIADGEHDDGTKEIIPPSRWARHKPTKTYYDLKGEGGLKETADIDANGPPGTERFIDGEGTGLEKDLRSRKLTGRGGEPGNAGNAPQERGAVQGGESGESKIFRGTGPETPLTLRLEEADAAKLHAVANKVGAEGTRWYYKSLADIFAGVMPGRLSDWLSRATTAFSVC